MINVLIVEDSLPVRLLLQQILETDPELRVVGMVESGEAALLFLQNKKNRVDVVTMDIIMPGMDGFAAARRIMETTPLPIVIVSAAYKSNETENSFMAMEAGAVAIIEKPVAMTHPDYPRITREMVETVKLMAGVKVVTRWPRNKESQRTLPGISPVEYVIGRPKKFDLIAIGSSTGGPPVLQTLLSALGSSFPLPILVVQHINPGFIGGMARWLENVTGIPIRIPTAGEICRSGHVYLAPDNYHMGISLGLRIHLDQSEPEKGQRPAVSYLFRSAANYFPKSSIGVLLTGMGSDGAAELNLMRENGSITFAQDEESCVVFGMPGEAVKIGAAHFVLPPAQIAAEILKMVS